MLLQRPPERETWQRLKPQTRVASNDYLVTLPGYRSELRLDSGVSLALWKEAHEAHPSRPPRASLFFWVVSLVFGYTLVENIREAMRDGRA